MSAPNPTTSPPPITQVSLLGDTSEWDKSAPDIDLDDDLDLPTAVTNVITANSVGSSNSHHAHQHQSHSFVKEADEIELLLLKLPYDMSAPQRISEIFDQYQEQCELLDPHLPHTITTLMNYVHGIIRPGKSNPVPPINSTTGAILLNVESKSQSYVPSTPACPSSELLTRVFKVIYTLSKVRGYKTIVHFFPHEVADLEPTLSLLQQQSMEEYETWETRYGLLLWLSIIVLIPFDLTTVDSSMTQQATPATPKAGDATPTPSNSGGIISSLISLGERYMSDTGPPREAAAVMLAKLFSRADMHASHLAAFFHWCTREIHRVTSAQLGTHASSKNVFTVTGIFRSLVEIFRHAPRDVLLKHVQQIFTPILMKEDQTFGAKSTNTLLRKLFIKLSQRVGLTYLPVRVAKWRYQRGHRSLLTTLQQATCVAVTSSTSSNPILGSSHATPATLSSSSTMESTEEDEDVPSEIEDIIQILLDGLRDRDTIVRWSSAKGIGRLTNCLPASFGDDVVGSVLDLFSGRESDGAWHGGCLALAELARRGLLLPERLKQVVPITLKALTYDQRTATHSIGAHVRDASCYVQWAFARAYAPDVMTPYMQSLAAGLLTICVFDREVNVRRASSAAFQEHVGRQGSASFKHGMEILQIADYFTVSNRNNAYTNVAFQIAKYEDYTLPLIEHLLTYKIRHWEEEIRELTSTTLGILTKVNEQSKRYMKEAVVKTLLDLIPKSNDLLEKHGAILALAEILKALHSLDAEHYVELSLRVRVCDVVNELTSKANEQLLNGRGGQIMREAICHLIGVIAQIGLLFSNATTLKYMRPYQTVLDENLGHTNVDVQAAAIRAVEQYIRVYYVPTATDDPKAVAEKMARAKQVIDHYVRTLSHPSSLDGVTRGFAAALGTLPRALLVTSSVKAMDVYSAVTTTTASSTSSSSSPTPATVGSIIPPSASSLIYQPLSRILQTLIMASTECGQSDPETRRNSVQSLVKLMDTITDEDLLQWMTPMPTPPPTNATITIAGASTMTSVQLKAAQKAQKLKQESVNKYWHRDLVEFGLGNRIYERVSTALLIGLDDYATDNRGDVGSWVREAAMIGLEGMVLKLARIQQREQATDATIYPVTLSQKVFSGLLKQSVEKIDRVREKSGQIFHRLLWSSEPEVPFVPLRSELRAKFPLVDNSNKNVMDWSSPSQTFPLITPIMAMPSTGSEPVSYPYHRPILSGLLISVGGLTESVVKSSSEAFMTYVSNLSSSVSANDSDAAHSLELLKLLAADLLTILQTERGHQRVIVPAFKTLELLLSQNLLEPLTLEVCSFASDLQARVWKEVSKSSNIHKLMASISVLVGLLTYPPPLRSVTFQCLLTLLGHPTFPKIRRLTGEALYNALLISEEFIPGVEEQPEKAQQILDILTLTPWDGPLPQAQQERDKLYGLLQVDKPTVKPTKAGAKGATNSTTTPANPGGDISALGTDYSSLVRNIGY